MQAGQSVRAKTVSFAETNPFSIDMDEGRVFAGIDGGKSLFSDTNASSDYANSGLKRAFDIIVASAAILFFSPFLLLLVLALVLQDGFSIIYKHERIGKDGRRFQCLKFRSMVRDSQAQLDRLLATCPASRREWEETQKLRNDPRIHPVGRLLRKSSLDELPQLLNVLRGDMSIIGPRPIVTDEICRYGDNFSSYAAVRPGLTGLWQVSGRSDVSYPRRVAMDTQYVATVSFTNDVAIMIKTVKVVLAGHGSC